MATKNMLTVALQAAIAKSQELTRGMKSQPQAYTATPLKGVLLCLFDFFPCVVGNKILSYHKAKLHLNEEVWIVQETLQWLGMYRSLIIGENGDSNATYHRKFLPCDLTRVDKAFHDHSC